MQNQIIFNYNDVIQELNEIAEHLDLKVDMDYFNSEDFKAECDANQSTIDRLMGLLRRIERAHCKWGDNYFDFPELDALGDPEEAEMLAEIMLEELKPMQYALHLLAELNLPIVANESHEAYIDELYNYEHPMGEA
mgnify:CR=1 FL=1|tara:strand:+ start:104 stop:511 length:408 start_codon:yes stop_codon:yes gene_type:complete